MQTNIAKNIKSIHLKMIKIVYNRETKSIGLPTVMMNNHDCVAERVNKEFERERLISV